jgi:hypothetical protein
MIKKVSIYTSVFTILVTSLLICQRISDDISMDEYAVYSDFYNNGISEVDSLSIDKLVFIDSTTTRYKLSDDELKYLESNFGLTLSESLVEDFRQKNFRTYKINPFFDLEIDYVLISQNELNMLFEKDGWAAFYEEYPNSQGITNLSRVGFNHEKSEALFYVGTQSAGLSGIGYFIYLKKENGIWNEYKSKDMWVS